MDSQNIHSPRIMSDHAKPVEAVMLSKERWDDVRQRRDQGGHLGDSRATGDRPQDGSQDAQGTLASLCAARALGYAAGAACGIPA